MAGHGRKRQHKPALVRIQNVGDRAHDYQGALDTAGVARAAQEDVFQFMVTFRDHVLNEDQFKKDTSSAINTTTRRFLSLFGERIWGNDRKYMRAGLPNGGLRYTPATPSGNTGKLIKILAPAFRAMRVCMFKPAVSSQRIPQ